MVPACGPSAGGLGLWTFRALRAWVWWPGDAASESTRRSAQDAVMEEVEAAKAAKPSVHSPD